MNTDKECLKFEMPKMPKVENRIYFFLTPNSKLKTPNFLGADEHG
jgi:hypothetical protein